MISKHSTLRIKSINWDLISHKRRYKIIIYNRRIKENSTKKYMFPLFSYVMHRYTSSIRVVTENKGILFFGDDGSYSGKIPNAFCRVSDYILIDSYYKMTKFSKKESNEHLKCPCCDNLSLWWNDETIYCTNCNYESTSLI